MHTISPAAGAAWFAVPHADVARRTNVSAVTRSVLIVFLGIAAFAVSLAVGDAGSTLSMLLMTVGTIVLLWGLFSLFWKSKHWVYLPTASSLSQESLFFDGTDLNTLLSQLQSPSADHRTFASVKSNGNVRLDYVYSRDHQFVAAQLYRFVPYTYEPASSVFYFTGSSSEAFLHRLEQATL